MLSFPVVKLKTLQPKDSQAADFGRHIKYLSPAATEGCARPDLSVAGSCCPGQPGSAVGKSFGPSIEY